MKDKEKVDEYRNIKIKNKNQEAPTENEALIMFLKVLHIGSAYIL